MIPEPTTGTPTTAPSEGASRPPRVFFVLPVEVDDIDLSWGIASDVAAGVDETIVAFAGNGDRNRVRDAVAQRLTDRHLYDVDGTAMDAVMDTVLTDRFPRLKPTEEDRVWAFTRLFGVLAAVAAAGLEPDTDLVSRNLSEVLAQAQPEAVG